MNRIILYQGHVLAVLQSLPPNSVHCCVTSPPYWGLRRYLPEGDPLEGFQVGLEPTIEEYVAKIVEIFREVRRALRSDGCMFLNLGDSYYGGGGAHKESHANPGISKSASRCGVPKGPTTGRGERGPGKALVTHNGPNRTYQAGLKPKDLCMIPARVALALQADGWWLRSDIIWSKSNPMPESCTDRPTTSHEHIFLLTKAARYYYDAEAIREPVKPTTNGKCSVRPSGDSRTRSKENWGIPHEMTQVERSYDRVCGANARSVWTIATAPFPGAHFATFPPAIPERCIQAGTSEKGCCPKCGAPWLRVVEKGEPKPHPLRMSNTSVDQFSMKDGVYLKSETLGKQRETTTTGWRPGCRCSGPDLEIINSPIGNGAGDDPTILTGRKGMNRPRKETEGTRPITRHEQGEYAAQLKKSPHLEAMRQDAGMAMDHYLRTDKSGARPIPGDLLDKWIEAGWLSPVIVPENQPLEPTPCTVLDPFAGASTTLLVAARLGRDSIGIELNPAYVKMGEKRLRGEMGMLAEVEVKIS